MKSKSNLKCIHDQEKERVKDSIPNRLIVGLDKPDNPFEKNRTDKEKQIVEQFQKGCRQKLNPICSRQDFKGFHLKM